MVTRVVAARDSPGCSASHRTLAPFTEAEPARLLVLCANLALRRSFLNRFVRCSAEQRRAANASAASYVRREHGAEVFLIGLCGAAHEQRKLRRQVTLVVKPSLHVLLRRQS